MFDALLLAAALALASYTQLTHLTAIPGLHFDEAWQGLFAHRIAAEPGFFPSTAMNSYTSPVIHYLLAGAFKVFGPSLTSMRGAYAAMNLLTLASIAALLRRRREKRAAAWFALFWALLPMSVHTHRFYIEMTGFFGACLAMGLWGLALWSARPKLSFILVCGSIAVGSYSHVLFVAVFAGVLFTAARHWPAEFTARRARLAAGATALLLIPLAIRMAAGLGKPLPAAMAGALGALAAWAFAAGWAWDKIPAFLGRGRIDSWLVLIAAPFLVAYVFLIWNGNWPYAQATGFLDWRWLPLNATIFVTLALTPRLLPSMRPARHDPSSVAWTAFIATFVASSALIFKQSPRYYMAPTILAMLWISLTLARVKKPALQAALAATFTLWNFWCFERAYIFRFAREGSTTIEFRAGPFHDNGRDFRPFQKAFAWTVEHNCQQELRWVEDDRFLLPIEFLRLTAPQPKGPCPWGSGDLFFSHINEYDRTIRTPRHETNTPAPTLAPHVKLLAHSPDWGDLAFWIRRK